MARDFCADDRKANVTLKRFVSVYHPDGVGVPIRKDPAWKTELVLHGGEKDFQLTKVLDVLELPRKDITIYSDLSTQPSGACTVTPMRTSI